MSALPPSTRAGRKESSWQALLFCCAFAGASAHCAGTAKSARGTPSSPPPPSSQVNGLGFDDAVQLGGAYAARLGYDVQLADAVLTPEHFWKMRFSVKNKQESAELVLQVDALTREIRRAEKIPSTAPADPGAR